MSLWDWLWIGWLGIFAVIEGIALKREAAGDTFSEAVWRWFAVDVDANKRCKRGAKLWRFRRFTLLALVAWLALHFLGGGAF